MQGKLRKQWTLRSKHGFSTQPLSVSSYFHRRWTTLRSLWIFLWFFQQNDPGVKGTLSVFPILLCCLFHVPQHPRPLAPTINFQLVGKTLKRNRESSSLFFFFPRKYLCFAWLQPNLSLWYWRTQWISVEQMKGRRREEMNAHPGVPGVFERTWQV